jgi:hypothetical protein
MAHRLHLCHIVINVPQRIEGVSLWGEVLGLTELPVSAISEPVYRKLGLTGSGVKLLIQQAEKWPDERYGDPAIHFDLQTELGKAGEAVERLESLGFKLVRWQSDERWPFPYPVMDDPTGWIRFCILDPPPYPDLLEKDGSPFEWDSELSIS